jgi:glycosyltransferase involved in cell wall biosynthesis
MELISCMLLTMPQRLDFFTHAVKCFYRQTWENKELVIIADPDCDEDAMRALAPDAKIGITHTKLTIGAKRNLACEAAAGAYIAVFDDDDHSSPGRLTTQYERITACNNKNVNVFIQTHFLYSGEWWMSPWNNKHGIGSSLFFARSYWESHPFEDISLGEDSQFTKQALADKTLCYTPECEMMYCTNHAGNTCQRSLPFPGWAKIPNYRWRDE